MGKLLNAAKAHVGVTAAGAVLLLGGGVATAAVVVTPAASTEDVYEVTEPATTMEAPVPPALVEVPTPVPAPAPVAEVAPEPVAPPADGPVPATVEVVPKPAPRPLPEGHRMPDLAPGQDPQGVGSIDPDGNYVPAPPIQREGEPPPAANWGQKGAPAELLPGEPGYVAPVTD